jgi:hypothetical protein
MTLFLPRFPFYWVHKTPEKRHIYLLLHFQKMLAKKKMSHSEVAKIILRYK